MKIKLAELVIDINDPGKYTVDMCKNYVCTDSEQADFAVVYDNAMLEKEKKVYPDAPIDYLENILLYREICRMIIEFGAMLVHSAAIAVDGRGYLFTASRGTGKTTHMNLWLNKFKERAVVINGDKPIIRECEGEFYVYGTPWCGKEGINNNIHVPIAGICILERGKENRIERVSTSEALAHIMGQTVRPNDITKLLDILDKLIKKVPVYRLYCNMEPEAAEVAYRGMNGI